MKIENRTICENRKGGDSVVNVNKLRGKIVENGMTIGELAKKLA